MCTFVDIVFLSAGSVTGACGAGGGGVAATAGVHCLLGHSLELVHFLGGGVDGGGGKRLFVGRGWATMSVVGLEVGRVEE